MASNNFFAEHDFDIQANIESALGEISFSGIELPDDINKSIAFGDDIDVPQKHSSRFSTSRSFSKPLPEPIKLPAFSTVDDSFLKNLDVAKFDDLDMLSSKGKSRTKTFPALEDSFIITDPFQKEIDDVVKSLPDKLVGSMQFEDFTHKPASFNPPKPKSILKPFKPPRNYIDTPEECKPEIMSLKSRLDKLRSTSLSKKPAESDVKISSQDIKSDNLITHLQDIITFLTKEIQRKKDLRERIERNTKLLSERLNSFSKK